MNERRRSLLSSWLRLFRVPLAASALCDIAAGSCLAGGFDVRVGRLVLAGATSLCLYAAGMTLNALVDLDFDREHASSRPLVRGEISPRAARLALIVLGAAALSVGAWLGPGAWGVALAIFLAILLYHFVSKRNLLGGPASLGLIRALNMTLGYQALTYGSIRTDAIALITVAAYGLYVAGASAVAAMEDREYRPVRFHVALAVALCALLSAAPLGWDRADDWRLPVSGLVASACFGLLVVTQRPRLRGVCPAPASLRSYAGLLLTGFYVFDASVAAGSGHAQVAAAVLLAFMVGRWAARSYPPS